VLIVLHGRNLNGKSLLIASWNVEHFKQDSTRVDRVIDFVAAQNPDMLALYEVESKEVFASVTAKFPGYTFQITEGEESQEILVRRARLEVGRASISIRHAPPR